MILTCFVTRTHNLNARPSLTHAPCLDTHAPRQHARPLPSPPPDPSASGVTKRIFLIFTVFSVPSRRQGAPGNRGGVRGWRYGRGVGRTGGARDCGGGRGGGALGRHPFYWREVARGFGTCPHDRPVPTVTHAHTHTCTPSLHTHTLIHVHPPYTHSHPTHLCPALNTPLSHTPLTI